MTDQNKNNDNNKKNEFSKKASETTQAVKGKFQSAVQWAKKPETKSVAGKVLIFTAGAASGVLGFYAKNKWT